MLSILPPEPRSRFLPCLVTALVLFLLSGPGHESSAQPSPSPDTLRSLFPETLAGRTRGEVRTSTKGGLVAKADYHPTEDTLHTVRLRLAYGKERQRVVEVRYRRSPGKRLETTALNGYEGVLYADPEAVRGRALVGRLVVAGGIEAQSDPLDPGAAQEELLDAVRSLNLDSLEEFVLSPREYPPPLKVPKGFLPHFRAASVRGLAIVHPSDWSAFEVPRGGGLVTMRDSAAAAKIKEEGLAMRSGETLQLHSSENVVLSASMVEEGEDPNAFVESAVEGAPLKQADVVQAPTKTWEGIGVEAQAQGKDAAGHSVVWRLIAVSIGDRLVQVSVLRPEDVSGETEDNISKMLNYFDQRFSLILSAAR